MNNLIIYDWDYTLFPNSFILEKNPINQSELALLEDKNIRLLEKSRELGITIIITNAATQWIYNSSEQFMPTLYKYIKENDILIVSAREYATNKHIFDYEKWKDLTFYNTIRQYALTHGSLIHSIPTEGYSIIEIWQCNRMNPKIKKENSNNQEHASVGK